MDRTAEVVTLGFDGTIYGGGQRAAKNSRFTGNVLGAAASNDDEWRFGNWAVMNEEKK